MLIVDKPGNFKALQKIKILQNNCIILIYNENLMYKELIAKICTFRLLNLPLLYTNRQKTNLNFIKTTFYNKMKF